MKQLEYKNGSLYFDSVKVESVLKKHSTPVYLYSEKQIVRQYKDFLRAANGQEIHKPLICFALKANPNPALIASLFKAGAGADIVSAGELKRALDNGCDPMKIVFSGVGKTETEINHALNASPKGIYSFNVESTSEIEMINKLAAKKHKIARIALRINPKVHAKTHRHISTGFKTHKFGILKEDVMEFFNSADQYKNIKIVGLSVHIGSQLTKMKATKKAIKEVCEIASEIKYPLEFIDVGGGLGVDYKKKEKTPSVDKYMRAVSKTLAKYSEELKYSPRIVFEPGRFICASAGVFLTKVIRTKQSEDCYFAIVDGGMNDFVRTSLYEAYHKIIPLTLNDNEVIKTEIVGPICETADSFAPGRKIQKLNAGDHLAVLDVGAYGHSMSSNYNLRSRPDELVIQADKSIKVFEYKL